MRLAIALSGGGVRAAVFHCGVLQRLALDRLLEQTTFVSTVSGGSLFTGLIVCRNGHKWPSSEEYLGSVLPQVIECLTTAKLQRSYVWRSVVFPWRLAQGRAEVMAKQLETEWGISGTLQDIPATPRWFINATCYETGKNWRFSQSRMGDYLTGYVLTPSVTIADAIAASAAFPGLIGPLTIRAGRYQWYRYENGEPSPTTTPVKQYELWDGGVYDNLGVEPLFKSGDGFREGIDLLLVSDASAALSMDPRTVKERALRLVDIATDQVRGLRSRAVVTEFVRRKGSGAYFKMGKTVEKIYGAVKQRAPMGEYLSEKDVKQAATFPTTLRRLTAREFTRLRRHGFEVADATLATRLKGQFSHRATPQ